MNGVDAWRALLELATRHSCNRGPPSPVESMLGGVSGGGRNFSHDRDLERPLRVPRLVIEKQDLTLRLLAMMSAVSLLTFGALVETYKLLF